MIGAIGANGSAPVLADESAQKPRRLDPLITLSREFVLRHPDYTTDTADELRERLTRKLMSHLDEIAFQLSVPGDARNGAPTLFSVSDGLSCDEADTITLCFLEHFAGDYLSETARRMEDWLREELSEG